MDELYKQTAWKKITIDTILVSWHQNDISYVTNIKDIKKTLVFKGNFWDQKISLF